MKAAECIDRIAKTKLLNGNLKYCYVTSNKLPVRVDGTMAKPNKLDDFVDLDELVQENMSLYAGVGISIQASNICAIDVDKCFSIPNDINSISDIGSNILNLFKNIAYCEFSFSGTGLRILFRMPVIENYSEQFYIKNSALGIEYYQPSDSYRYVTVTGNVIYDNDITSIKGSSTLQLFLLLYMKKPKQTKTAVNSVDTVSPIDKLMKKVRYFYLTNTEFQNLWFGQAPGSGKNESELDYHLLSMLYENITQNKDVLKEIFEQSSYFKSKDEKHIKKWEYHNYRYYEYVYDQIRRRKII